MTRWEVFWEVCLGSSGDALSRDHELCICFQLLELCSLLVLVFDSINSGSCGSCAKKKTQPYCTQQLFSRRDTEILPKPLRMPTTTCKAERLKDQNWSVESCNVEMRNAMAIIIKNARLKNFADANAAMPRTWPSNKVKHCVTAGDCRVLCGEVIRAFSKFKV